MKKFKVITAVFMGLPWVFLLCNASMRMETIIP